MSQPSIHHNLPQFLNNENNNQRQTKNWISLTYNVRNLSEKQKHTHASLIVKRKEQVSQQENQKPMFLQLLFRIRNYAIIKSYFPHGSIYEKEIGDIQNHQGWNDLMTSYEKSLLNEFYNAYLAIEKDPRDTKKFDKVDRKFGKYRYEKWLKSQNDV